MDLITRKMLKELPPKGMILLTYLFNAILRHHYYYYYYSVALVRERTIPTERPPPVGEVSANFCG